MALTRLLVAGFIVGAAASANGQTLQTRAPAEISGEWTIGDVIGTQPMFLEVPRMEALLGRKVVIGDTLELWDIYSGKITSFQKRTVLLRDYISLPIGALPREIAEADHRFDIYELGTIECRSHETKLDACPVIAIGHDLDADQIGLITLPFGFAAFEPMVNGLKGRSETFK